MTTEILNGVGKKLRSSFLAGKTTENEIVRCYNRNQKEADAFDPFGLTVFELLTMRDKAHNPLLRTKLDGIIEQNKHKSRCSVDQNKLSLMKLDYYQQTALGVGLRVVMKFLRKRVRYTGDVEAEILLLLMEIEFANLVAKKRQDKKKVCYERKDILLMRLADLLDDCGWKHGISYSAGKNASYLVVVYLPDGTQMSWHCNNWRMTYYYDEVAFLWDGLACSTFEKLLSYAHSKYNIGDELIKFSIAA